MGVNEYIKIGERIKQLRKYIGMSQKEMANTLGLNVSTYSNYENGYREPNLDIIIEIARILNISLSVLLEGDWDKYIGQIADEFGISVDQANRFRPTLSEKLNEFAKYHAEQLEGINDNFGHDQPSGYNDFLNSYAEHAFNNSSSGINLQQFASSDGLLHDGESKILKSYDKLNTGGKLEAIKRVEELTLIEKYTRKDDDGNNE